MEYTFLKKESISFNGIDAKHFNVGDKIEGSSINKVSPTLLDYYIKHEILSTGEVFEILDNKEVKIEKKKIVIESSNIVSEIEEINEMEIPEDATILEEVEIQENSEEDMEVKSCNPVLENKAITNLDNKSLEELSVNQLKKILYSKGINFDKRAGKQKLIKLLEENK